MSKLNFKNAEFLNVVVRVINEANKFVENKWMRVNDIKDNSILEIMSGLGAGAGTFFAGMGVVGAVGVGSGAVTITSGLAAIGGSMVGGLAAFAFAPLAIGGAVYYGVKSIKESNQLKTELKRLMGETETTIKNIKEEITESSGERKEALDKFKVILESYNFQIREDLNELGIG